MWETISGSSHVITLADVQAGREPHFLLGARVVLLEAHTEVTGRRVATRYIIGHENELRFPVDAFRHTLDRMTHELNRVGVG